MGNQSDIPSQSPAGSVPRAAPVGGVSGGAWDQQAPAQTMQGIGPTSGVVLSTYNSMPPNATTDILQQAAVSVVTTADTITYTIPFTVPATAVYVLRELYLAFSNTFTPPYAPAFISFFTGVDGSIIAPDDVSVKIKVNGVSTQYEWFITDFMTAIYKFPLFLPVDSGASIEIIIRVAGRTDPDNFGYLPAPATSFLAVDVLVDTGLQANEEVLTQTTRPIPVTP